MVRPTSRTSLWPVIGIIRWPGPGPDWRARRGRAGRGGRIEWIAPAGIDPAQQPRINTYYHPEDHLLADEDDTTGDGDPP